MNRHDAQLEAMERNARLALFYQDQLFEIAVCEHQRQAREAVDQALSEPQGSYDDARISMYSESKVKEGWHT